MRLSQHMAQAVTDSLRTGRAGVLPAGGHLPWKWFSDLCRARQVGPGGVQPLTHAEIEAYARSHRWPLEPRHYDVLFAMDRAYLDHSYRQQQLRAAAQPSANDPILDRGAFDVMFG